MSAYMQMGHDTENLVGEPGLEDFKGIILSPVNRFPDELAKNIKAFREKGDYDIVLDSQLYSPRSLREKLKQYPYFPTDLDTADTFSMSWWQNIIDSLSKYSKELSIDSVTSPVFLPKVFNLNYYSVCSEIAQQVEDSLKGTGMKILHTVMVELSHLADDNFLMECASIVTQPDCSGIYIVFVSNVDPRRELSDSAELYGAMKFINELESSGKTVMVSNCSSDMLLFKAAGASHCATGKFFNLRRFTVSRFEEPSESGGGQLAYWFEHSLLSFLREADLLRLQNNGHNNLVGNLHSSNCWSDKILSQLDEQSGKAWLALGWRQFLCWFAKTERTIDSSDALQTVRDWSKSAEEAWLRLEDDDIFLEERRNNGTWLRPWRQALSSFKKYLNK
jgi:hypothetical protein